MLDEGSGFLGYRATGRIHMLEPGEAVSAGTDRISHRTAGVRSHKVNLGAACLDDVVAGGSPA